MVYVVVRLKEQWQLTDGDLSLQEPRNTGGFLDLIWETLNESDAIYSISKQFNTFKSCY
jgi:hypothetical protein